MIVDRLTNVDTLTALRPELKRACEYLRTNDLRAIAVGRHDIDGERLFALVQEYTTRAMAECVWESHRRYIDVQHLVFGEERFGYANLVHARERDPYDGARDVAFYEPGTDFITLRPGMLAIFGPEDVHAPCGAAGEPVLVRKVVVKVRVPEIGSATQT